MTTTGGNNAVLTANLITDPTLHNLVMRIGKERLDVLITSRVNDNATIFVSIPLAQLANRVTALEEAVYGNPLLTSDFHTVEIVLDNDRFFVMPHEEANEEEIAKRVTSLWPPSQQTTELQTVQTVVEDERTVMVTAVERPLLAFIRRTWHKPRLSHRMSVFARYHGIKNRLGNMGKIHVYVMPGRLDLIVYGREGLYMANTFRIGDVDDASFYILAAARHFEYEDETDRIFVDGPAEMRDSLVKSLRKFVTTVLPQVRPAEITAKADNIPVEMLLANKVS